MGLDDQPAVYHAGRATLCASPADLERYDHVYAAWFGGQRTGTKDRRAAGAGGHPGRPHGIRQRQPAPAPRTTGCRSRTGELDRGPAAPRRRHARPARPRGLARAAVRHAATRGRPRRRAHRHTAARRGRRRRAAHPARHAAPDGGAGEVRWRRRGDRPRRVVLLVDVSGSMSAYADALIRLAHAYCAAGVPTEVFTLGTRLTQVTRPLHQRDPDRGHRRGGPWSPTGPVAPGWPRGSRSSSTGGVVGGWPGARSSSSSATGGSATSPRPWGSRRAACGRSPTGWCGSTPTGADPATSRCRGHHGGPAPRRRLRRGALDGGVRGADGGGRACVTCCPS